MCVYVRYKELEKSAADCIKWFESSGIVEKHYISTNPFTNDNELTRLFQKPLLIPKTLLMGSLSSRKTPPNY